MTRAELLERLTVEQYGHPTPEWSRVRAARERQEQDTPEKVAARRALLATMNQRGNR